MTSRERIFAAINGQPVDRIPVAPYFWGAEYAWKLTDKPLWEIMHGKGDMGMALLEGLDERHECDWLLPTHGSSGALVGKSYNSEDICHVYFTDDSTGEEFVFHKEGHWLLPKSEVGKARGNNKGTGVEPPLTKAAADEWLKKTHHNLDKEPAPHIPNRKMRERFPDRFLIGCMLPPFADLAYTLGFEPTLILLHENPSLCAYMIEKRLARTANQCKNMLADGFDAGLMVDSFASTDIMSPKTYTDWVAPLHKLVSDELHNVGMKSVLYNTGNILPLLDSIGQMGYDVITLEERIKGVEMPISEVRNKLGPDACIFGNFDSYLLQQGDREAIAAEVRRHVNDAGPRAFGMGTGSPVCDATDPEVMDFWINEVQQTGV